ncbi:DUF3048 domain-containing protein [Christensenellaceae bacterium OttesenSCG-928-K19]|nr:DUF3048 domain-containing protein [Christensenellaceae bacterium OttesenSCG-928-K19]
MKKTLLIALAVILAIGVFFGCSKEEEPEPEPTTIEAATAEPTQEPEWEDVEEEYTPPENISPTTGLEGTTTEYKPLFVQIGNESHERPQQGLQDADIVYETLIEGTDTRFSAVFNDVLLKDDAPEEFIVGPVRSSRYYHQWLQSEWDAIYIHMGGPDTTGSWESDIYGNSGEHIKQRISGAGKGTAHSELFFKWRENKSVSDYAATDLIADLDVYNYEPQPLQQLNFYPPEEYEGKQEVKSVELPFLRHAGWVTYEYNNAANKLERSMKSSEGDVSAFTDLNTGEIIQVQNLIVQYTYVNIMPGDLGGRRKVDLVGSGRADFVINGKHIQGTWERADYSVATTYKDDMGEEITLVPGNTWIAVHPKDQSVVFNYADGTSYETPVDENTPQI